MEIPFNELNEFKIGPWIFSAYILKNKDFERYY